MPYDDPDPTDPMTLHGVEIPTDDDSAMREMAECFIEEFARMGFDEDRLMRMFKATGYAGPNLALQKLGEDEIRSMIGDQLGLRRQAPSRVAVERYSGGSIGLPVLDLE